MYTYRYVQGTGTELPQRYVQYCSSILVGTEEHLQLLQVSVWLKLLDNSKNESVNGTCHHFCQESKPFHFPGVVSLAI